MYLSLGNIIVKKVIDADSEPSYIFFEPGKFNRLLILNQYEVAKLTEFNEKKKINST